MSWDDDFIYDDLQDRITAKLLQLAGQIFTILDLAAYRKEYDA
jgi:hypothetical protein